MGNWPDLCHRAAPPRRRGRHVTEDGACRVRATRGRRHRGRPAACRPNLTRRPRPSRPSPGWRGGGGCAAGRTATRPRGQHRRFHPAGHRRCCCLAGGGGGAPRPCRRGGERAATRLDLPLLGGRACLCLWRAPPPFLCTCRCGRRSAGRYKSGRAAVHCRASEGGSVQLFSLVVTHDALEETSFPGSHHVGSCG